MRTNHDMNAGSRIERNGAGGAAVTAPEWWLAVPPGERAVICAIMRMLRVIKHSQDTGAARAAAKWERGLGCFMKMRLRRGERLKAKG